MRIVVPWALLGRWLLAPLHVAAQWLALALVFAAYVFIVWLIGGLVGVALWVGVTLTIGLVLAPMIGSHFARVPCHRCGRMLLPSGKHRACDVYKCPAGVS